MSSSKLSWLYSSEQYSVNLLRTSCYSVRHFPDLFWIVEDLPCLSEVRSFTSWYVLLLFFCSGKSRKENPQKLTQLSLRSQPRHPVGKRTAQKDTTTDTTGDSQVNSNLPNKWSPASPTLNNYFYLFLYSYITWITTNNNAPHLKSPKNQKQKKFKFPRNERLSRPPLLPQLPSESSYLLSCIILLLLPHIASFLNLFSRHRGREHLW